MIAIYCKTTSNVDNFIIIGHKTGILNLSSCLYSLLLRYHQYLSDPDIFLFSLYHGGVFWYFEVIRRIILWYLCSIGARCERFIVILH